MAQEHQMSKADAILKFMFAGDAIFTLRSTQSGARYTFRVDESPRKGGDKRPSVFFVKLLTGPDNLRDYTFIGTIFERKNFKLGSNSTMKMDSPPVVAFKWSLDAFLKGKVPASLEVWHIGRCGRCKHALTDPVSIATGLGPDCRELVGVPAAVLPVGASTREQGNFGSLQHVLAPAIGSKFERMKKFRDLNDNAGDAKFLALSQEAGFSIGDWEWFSKQEAKPVGCNYCLVKNPIYQEKGMTCPSCGTHGTKVATPYDAPAQSELVGEFRARLAQHTKPKPVPPVSVYAANGFRSKAEEPTRYAPADIVDMVKFQKDTDPDTYYSIRIEGMTEDQVRQFWYRRFESIPLVNFKLKGVK